MPGAKFEQDTNKFYKTRPCFAFQRVGRCLDGAKCKYAHSESERRDPEIQFQAASVAPRVPPPAPAPVPKVADVAARANWRACEFCSSGPHPLSDCSQFFVKQVGVARFESLADQRLMTGMAAVRRREDTGVLTQEAATAQRLEVVIENASDLTALQHCDDVNRTCMGTLSAPALGGFLWETLVNGTAGDQQIWHAVAEYNDDAAATWRRDIIGMFEHAGKGVVPVELRGNDIDPVIAVARCAAYSWLQQMRVFTISMFPALPVSKISFDAMPVAIQEALSGNAADATTTVDKERLLQFVRDELLSATRDGINTLRLSTLGTRLHLKHAVKFPALKNLVETVLTSEASLSGGFSGTVGTVEVTWHVATPSLLGTQPVFATQDSSVAIATGVEDTTPGTVAALQSTGPIYTPDARDQLPAFDAGALTFPAAPSDTPQGPEVDSSSYQKRERSRSQDDVPAHEHRTGNDPALT
jgi:hypothetical protein